MGGGGGLSLLELQIPAGEQELPLTHCLSSALYQDANDPYKDYQCLICYSDLVPGGSSNFSEGFNRFALQIGVAGRTVRIPRPADRQSVMALISQGAREQGRERVWERERGAQTHDVHGLTGMVDLCPSAEAPTHYQ